jgi:hypothetical protein
MWRGCLGWFGKTDVVKCAGAHPALRAAATGDVTKTAARRGLAKNDKRHVK